MKVFRVISLILAIFVLVALCVFVYLLIVKTFSTRYDIDFSSNAFTNAAIGYIEKRYTRAEFIATAYSSSLDECDNTPFITASGQRVRWGIVAADKKYPFGTKIYIPYFQQVFEVQDRGGAIRGNRIDIWFPSKEAAVKFGVKRLICFIVSED